jgi:hypothetical protein
MVDISARWLLTLICGIAFFELVCASIYMRNHGIEPLLSGTEIMAILMLVFQSYFMRSDRKNGGN